MEPVSKTLNKHVTHVVFKDGRLTTWKKAQMMSVKIVSVLWVEMCRETGVHVDESLFPAVDTNEGFLLPIKKHKCMQPKDYVEKTPENNRKLQRRLNQMAKELALQKTAVTAETDVPILLFEDNGSLIYSPVNKIKDQCNTVERGIKAMKEKRENLSPTGSQMTQTLPSRSAGDCPLSTCILTNSEDVLLPEEQMENCLNSSCDYLRRAAMLKRQRKEVAEHACDTWSDIHVSMSASMVKMKFQSVMFLMALAKFLTNKSTGVLRKSRRLRKVLWFLELGHWISEEPYELSSSFPAAPFYEKNLH
ncbi:hypothetical protein IHE44_0009658 [Lamprotornis superbus]|uniref:BRCT domain-containing protein n=1 Tax=Lamprotornis superbus TaxID=245042 RepID=A0A835TXG7_9PASS|nr:hypothetical protein IHE44_0009658 [Lamprotornis superbus]